MLFVLINNLLPGNFWWINYINSNKITIIITVCKIIYEYPWKLENISWHGKPDM